MVDAPRPIRIGRQKLLKDGELERAVELAAGQAGADGCVLILLDADDDCPAELGPGLLQRAQTKRPDCAISVVLAKAEYEAWFLAAGDSIAGKRGIAGSVTPPPDPESIRDAKGWLSAHMPPGQPYRPTLHQSKLTAVFMTSANLTDAAFDRNIELGVLIRDRALAASVTSHFRGLIDRKLLWALPDE